jgi:predicted  nucleic acid-binding Zn-ribbon protein
MKGNNEALKELEKLKNDNDGLTKELAELKESSGEEIEKIKVDKFEVANELKALREELERINSEHGGC